MPRAPFVASERSESCGFVGYVTWTSLKLAFFVPDELWRGRWVNFGSSEEKSRLSNEEHSQFCEQITPKRKAWITSSLLCGSKTQDPGPPSRLGWRPSLLTSNSSNPPSSESTNLTDDFARFLGAWAWQLGPRPTPERAHPPEESHKKATRDICCRRDGRGVLFCY